MSGRSGEREVRVGEWRERKKRRGLVYGAGAVKRRRFGEGGESGGAEGVGRLVGRDGVVSWGRKEVVECKVAYGQVAVTGRRGI